MSTYHVRIHRERCKGCNLCVKACPKHVLKLSGNVNHSGYPYAEAEQPEACIGCLQCTDVCPDTAIEIHPVKAAAGHDGKRPA